MTPSHLRHRGVIDLDALLTASKPTPWDWGPWRLDPRSVVLVHTERQYEIDLESCTTSAHTLDWIMQIAAKTWADSATLAGLVRALDDLLHPQANLCSFGQSLRLNATAIRTMVAANAKRIPTQLIEASA